MVNPTLLTVNLSQRSSRNSDLSDLNCELVIQLVIGLTYYPTCSTLLTYPASSSISDHTVWSTVPSRWSRFLAEKFSARGPMISLMIGSVIVSMIDPYNRPLYKTLHRSDHSIKNKTNHSNSNDRQDDLLGHLESKFFWCANIAKSIKLSGDFNGAPLNDKTTCWLVCKSNLPIDKSASLARLKRKQLIWKVNSCWVVAD